MPLINLIGDLSYSVVKHVVVLESPHAFKQ